MTKKIFISYAHLDGKEYAVKLRDDLTDQHVAIWIDIGGIKPGQLWTKEIDDGLRDVDYFLAVITEKYLDSVGGIESYVKLASTFSEKKEDFVPLFFIPIEETKSSFFKAITGFDFSKNYKKGLRDLLKFLNEKESIDYDELISKIEGKESFNPFRRVRAEFFHNDYNLLATAFAEPEKEKYEMIQGDNPIIIFGGRGSGKTMILKSLTPEILLLRHNLIKVSELKSKGLSFLGIYFKLKRGSLFLHYHQLIVELGFKHTGIEKNYELYKSTFDKAINNQGKDDPILIAGTNAAWFLTLNEINFKILKAFLSELRKLREKSYLDLKTVYEEKIVERILDELNVSRKSVRKFDDLMQFIEKELKKIKIYIQNLAMPSGNPEVNWIQTDSEFLDEVIAIITNQISDLNDVRIYLLFDEFENLCPYQQSIINEWIKTSRAFTVKVASKFEGMYTNSTFQGQALQAGQDYFIWSLDYDLNDKKIKNQYQKLLIKICDNLLRIEGYKETNIKRILDVLKFSDLPLDVIDNEIKILRKQAQLDFDENKINTYRNKQQNAVIFRLLRKREKVKGRKSREKNYSGFETFTYLSSGIIRFFLNLVAMAFYKGGAEGVNIKEGEPINPEYQSWAAYIVSRIWLERISKNLEEYGEIAYQFVVDLGDIFRERLLNHLTEPETLSISIIDPHNLNDLERLKHMLDHSVRESILHIKLPTSGMKGKNPQEDQLKEYQLNRIYCPVLEISYANRWPRANKFTVDELISMIDSKKRYEIKKEIIKKQHGKLKPTKAQFKSFNDFQ